MALCGVKLFGPRRGKFLWCKKMVYILGWIDHNQVMSTNDKVGLQHRTCIRQKRQKKRAKRVRKTAEVFQRTVQRNQYQVKRLEHAVNTADIVNSRMERDKELCITPTTETTKYRKKREKLIGKHRGRRKFSMRALYTALGKVQKEIDKVPIFEHFIRRAYENDQVLKALLSKMLPDLKSIDAKVVQDSPFRLIIDLGQKPGEGTVPMLGMPPEKED